MPAIHTPTGQTQRRHRQQAGQRRDQQHVGHGGGSHPGATGGQQLRIPPADAVAAPDPPVQLFQKDQPGIGRGSRRQPVDREMPILRPSHQDACDDQRQGQRVWQDHVAQVDPCQSQQGPTQAGPRAERQGIQGHQERQAQGRQDGRQLDRRMEGAYGRRAMPATPLGP
ncbi:hypothetical protein AZA_35689 [Nitrospirillum viridazoti Y2]|nr:hypothetical protein AZA_35689 [Nitrospirillum amazonense Y2]